MNLVLWLIIFIFLFLSLLGSFIPLIPDVIPLWIGISIYHFFITNQVIPQSFFVLLILITILLIAADFMSNAYFVKKSGGSKKSILAAFIGLLLGMIFLGPLGIIVAPFFTVLAVEYFNNQDQERSFKIAFSTIIAYLGSGFIKAVVQIFIIIWFLYLVIF